MKFDTSIVIELSKRLSLCLNPTLPQGLSLKSLEIYGILLKLKNPFHLQIIVLGFLSYFPQSAGQAKLKFLDLMEEISCFYIQPVTIALLQGTEDKGEIYNKTIQIFEKLFENYPIQTDLAL